MKGIFVDRTEDMRRVMHDRALAVPASVSINDGSPVQDELIELCRGAEVILTEHTVISPTVLAACPKVRAIIFMGTGAGTYVDLEDAARRGVAVKTVPGYGDRAVAEHAFALMFAAARDIVRMDREIRAGIWAPRGGLQLGGQKIAIIGLGGIGATMADLCTGMGMDVIGWNRSPKRHPCFVPDLDEALKDVHIVSLHLSLNYNTQGLIDARRLSLPRPGFILVNTARAALVDEPALLAGLASGQVGHAALDVFPQEPLALGNTYAVLELGGGRFPSLRRFASPHRSRAERLTRASRGCRGSATAGSP